MPASESLRYFTRVNGFVGVDRNNGKRDVQFSVKLSIPLWNSLGTWNYRATIWVVKAPPSRISNKNLRLGRTPTARVPAESFPRPRSRKYLFPRLHFMENDSSSRRGRRRTQKSPRHDLRAFSRGKRIIENEISRVGIRQLWRLISQRYYVSHNSGTCATTGYFSFLWISCCAW